MDGPTILYAHVFEDGTIEQGTPGGITQENVRRVSTPFEEGRDTDGDGFPDEVITREMSSIVSPACPRYSEDT
jgi:hypothetical protein